MSFLNSGQIASVNGAFEGLHNFFAAKNTFYAIKKGETTIITQNENFNAFYRDFSSQDVQKTYETGVFNARAYYLNKGTNLYDISFRATSQVNLDAQVAENVIKIIVDESGKLFLDSAEKIKWDESWFDKKSLPKKHGLLQNNFHTYFLEEVK